MKDEILIEIAKLATGRNVPHYTVDDFDIRNNDGSIDIRFIDDLNTVVNIFPNGDVLVYFDGQHKPYIEKRVQNQIAIAKLLMEAPPSRPLNSLCEDEETVDEIISLLGWHGETEINKEAGHWDLFLTNKYDEEDFEDTYDFYMDKDSIGYRTNGGIDVVPHCFQIVQLLIDKGYKV
jgi:hypothetical protein